MSHLFEYLKRLQTIDRLVFEDGPEDFLRDLIDVLELKLPSFNTNSTFRKELQDLISKLKSILPDTQYDYTNQAWVVNGRYVRCGHLLPNCGCYGTLHEGEPVSATSELH